MPSEKEAGYLTDMLRHLELTERFVQGYGYDDLRNDARTLFAVIRGLEIISEASRRLSDELKARHPEIPWPQMAAAGNFYRHNYEEVTSLRVWKTLCEDLPPLGAVIEKELARE